jgi:hypothetical protein
MLYLTESAARCLTLNEIEGIAEMPVKMTAQVTRLPGEVVLRLSRGPLRQELSAYSEREAGLCNRFVDDGTGRMRALDTVYTPYRAAAIFCNLDHSLCDLRLTGCSTRGAKGIARDRYRCDY